MMSRYSLPPQDSANSEKYMEGLVKQRGSELVAAGYCLYSSSTHLAVTLRTGLHIFTLDDVTGEFYLTRSHVKMPSSGSIYSFNDANYETWSPAIQNYVQDFRLKRGPASNPPEYDRQPKARYIGALVADLHNVILNGGVFGYPGSMTRPEGKLRLVYEANPLALVAEEAGGRATNGVSRILSLAVGNIHQRTPLFIGSANDVDNISKYIRFYEQ
jgi:fructose-1,6-bisphosphatase I